MVVILAGAIGYAAYRTAKKHKKKRSERRQSSMSSVEGEEKPRQDQQQQMLMLPAPADAHRDAYDTNQGTSAGSVASMSVAGSEYPTPLEARGITEHDMTEYPYDLMAGEALPPYDPGNYEHQELTRRGSTAKTELEPSEVHPAFRDSRTSEQYVGEGTEEEEEQQEVKEGERSERVVL